MTQTHDDPRENAAGSDVRAGAPVWASAPQIRHTFPIRPVPRLAGAFLCPVASPHVFNPSVQPTFPSRGPAVVAGPIIVL
jgi:hypothetical protein